MSAIEDRTCRSVYLDVEYEKRMKFLANLGYSFTKMVKAIIDSEYDMEIKKWAEEQLKL